MKLSWKPVSVRLRAPVLTAHGELRDRDGFLVRVDEGRGEACPLPWFGTEDAAACERALSVAADKPSEAKSESKSEAKSESKSEAKPGKKE